VIDGSGVSVRQANELIHVSHRQAMGNAGVTGIVIFNVWRRLRYAMGRWRREAEPAAELELHRVALRS
jgi:hypothetical protein